jgi:hypothetical protein
MSKYINFINNSFGIFVILSLLAVSTIATLALSPVGIPATSSVAGIYTGDILSNLIPLKFEDTAASVNFSSQLVANSDKQVTYHLKFPVSNQKQFSDQILRITNQNQAPIKISITSQTATELSPHLHLALTDGKNTYRVHGANAGDGRIVTFIIPANQSMNLDMQVEQINGLAFEGNMALVVSY